MALVFQRLRHCHSHLLLLGAELEVLRFREQAGLRENGPDPLDKIGLERVFQRDHGLEDYAFDATRASKPSAKLPSFKPQASTWPARLSYVWVIDVSLELGKWDLELLSLERAESIAIR